MPNVFEQIERGGAVGEVPAENPFARIEGGQQAQPMTTPVSGGNPFAAIEAQATQQQPAGENPFEAIEAHDADRPPSANPFEQIEAGKFPPPGVRPPTYGFDGKPISDAEYAQQFTGATPQQDQTPAGRIGDAALSMGRDALALDIPLGPSDSTVDSIVSIAGEPTAFVAKAGLTVADAALRGVTAPLHALAGGAGQTVNELGLSQGINDKRPARDMLGMLDMAGLMAPGFPTGPRVKPQRGVRAADQAADANSPAPPSSVPAGAEAPPLGGAVVRSAENPQRQLRPDPNAPIAQANLADVQPMASNINLSRIRAPEDVKAIIQDVARRSEGFPEARRGRMTFEDIRELAPMVGMTPEKLAKRGIGKTLGSAEEMFAARQLLVAQADDVRRLARVANGGSDADKMAAMESLTRMVAIQEQVSGATAEAGRLLAQQRMVADAGKSADTIRRILDSSGGRVDDIITGINKLDNAPPEAIAAFAKEAWAAKSTDMVLEAWINALLSGPTTHATNMLSNTLVSTWAVPEALASAAVSKFTGSGISYREAFAKSFGALEGAKDGIRAGWRAFLSEEPSDLTSKVEARRYQAIPSKTFRTGAKRKEIGGFEIPLTGEIKIGGRQVRLPGRLLTAEDEFFKAIGYRQQINADAVRTALGEGRKGKAFARRTSELKAYPTDAMKVRARSAAEKQTFTNPLGVDGRALQAWANRNPAARVVVPFIRTPLNIVKFAAERSPLAPLFKEVRANIRGANGATARDEQLGRIALGSTVSAVAAYMAVDGTITGSGPTDPRKRSLMFATGWQPYSLKVGDTYYSYGRLEPLGTLLGVAADFTEMRATMSSDEEANLAALMMGSVSKNLVSKTWLRGPAELIEAVQDPDRYGGRYVQRLLSTSIPTGVAQYARNQDPYLREARTILDAIKSRVPGQRETLPARRDIFGEPIKLEGGLGPDMLSPIYTSQATNDPVAAELLRLDVLPSRLGRKIKGVELEAGEYDAYQADTGRTAHTMLQNVISLPEWQNIPDDAKADAVTDILRMSRDVGRARTMVNNPDLLLRIAAEKAKKAGVTLPQPVSAER